MANGVAFRQNRPLIGGGGLLPVTAFIESRGKSGDTFWKRPTAFWLLRGRNATAVQADRLLDAHALLGAALATPMLLTGAASAAQVL